MTKYERIAPGVYVDATNALHLDVPELLAAFGYADTERNRELVTRVAEEQLRATWPGVPITITDEPLRRPRR